MASGLIPPEIIDQIQTRSDIVEVIGNYVPLKKAGSNSWKACCPFHNEKTPSFHVRGDRQVFYCFGCHKGGNVFKFVMEKEGISFPEAAHLLASRCGVDIPENSPGADPREARAAANTRDRMYQLNEEFARFFEHQLQRYPDSPAAQYLASRQIPQDVVKQFRIGAAPDSWDAGLRFGKSLGFSEEEMLKAGVLHHNEERRRTYDLFRNRLTFAIWNEQGKVVGFSARTLESGKTNSPKYVNTPETPVFKKGNLLYALPFARQTMGNTGEAILCEGQLDTIALHRAGFQQAVAPQGTGFTPDQARLLRRYDVKRVLLAFDSDSAGQKAIRAALEILLPLDMEVRMIAIPGGKDPDELLRTAGPEAVRNAVNSSIPFLEYMRNYYAGIYDLNSPAGTGRAIEELVEILQLLENPVLRELYLKEAAGLFHIGVDALNSEMTRKIQRDRRRMIQQEPEKKTAIQPSRPDAFSNIMLTLLSLALTNEALARELAESLPPEYLRNQLPDQALNNVIACAMNGEYDQAAEAVSSLLNGTDQEADGRISRLLAGENPFPTKALQRKAMRECLEALHSLRQRRSEKEILDELRRTADPEKKMALLSELTSLKQTKQQNS